MCEVCGVSTHPPCGIICLSDCSVCWVTVVASEVSATEEALVGIAKVVKDKESMGNIDGATQVQFCSHQISLAQISKLIAEVHPAAKLDPSSRSSIEIFDLSFCGTLDDLAAKLKPRP